MKRDSIERGVNKTPISIKTLDSLFIALNFL